MTRAVRVAAIVVATLAIATLVTGCSHTARELAEVQAVSE